MQRPLFKQELATHVLPVTHRHEYDGGFDEVDVQIPFCCEQGFDKHGPINVAVVVLDFVVVNVAFNK